MARPSRRVLLCFSLLLWLSCEVEPPVQPGQNRAPTARIGGAQAIPEGTFIAFDASGSTDPDGDSLTYAWDFGDGQKRTGGLAPHAYRDEGSYQVSLIVTDYRGASDTAHATISVENAPPVITGLVIPSNPVIIGTPATIHVAFADPGTADSLIASVDWGDQSSSLIPSGSASHIYAAVGSYVVTATVRDNDGAVTHQSASRAIVIAIAPPNRPPVAHISGPSTIREGAAATFSADASTDPEGGPLRYQWDVGNTSYTRDDSLVRRGRYYQDDGVYAVRLIVSDSGGAKDTAQATLTVVNVPPVVSVSPPMQQAVGVPARTRITYSDSGSVDVLTITVFWGDGTSGSVSPTRDDNVDSLMHTYATPGSYVIHATIQDNDGGVSSAAALSPVIVFDATQRRTIAGYDVFDLGTLGGNTSRPRDFNDNRQIVGSSLTASGNHEAFLWDNGTLRALGTLGHLNSEAQKINNAGVIAGVVWSRPGYYQYEVSMPATWRNGVGALLTNSSFNQAATAIAMNEVGDIAWSAHGHEDPYAWVSRGGSWQQLGGLYNPRATSWGTSINERGQIVGSAYSEYTGESQWPPPHAFLWENGAMRDLGLLGFKPCRYYTDKNCGWARATSINERGQVVGYSTDSAGSVHAVLWENSTIRDLWAVPAGGYSAYVLINDAGQVAGSAQGEGFFWSDGRVYPLGSLGGGKVQVVDMNESGMVVGTSKTSSGEQHAFVWTREGGMVDLGTGPHAFRAAWVVGISFGGDIVGYTGPCNPIEGTCYPTETRAVMWRRL